MSTLLPIFLLLVSMVSIQIGASLAHHLFEVFGVGMSTVLRLVISTFVLGVIYQPQIKNFANPRLVWVVFSLAGFLFFLPLHASAENLSLKGIFFAALAGFFWAMYILMGRRTDPAHSSGKNTAIGMLIASLIVLPFGLGDFDASLLTLPHLAMAALVAVLSSALRYTLEMHALKKLSTRTFSILLSLEPGIAACMGLIFIGETLSFLHTLGMLFLMIASAGSAFTDYQDQKLIP